MRRVPSPLALLAGTVALLATAWPADLSAQAQRRPYRPPQVPNCGGPQPPGTTVPRADASGDRLYFRMVDSAGYDFEIWCISGFASVYYEYRISFPDGTWEEIDECELFWGSNVIVLHIEGDTITSDTTPNGAPLRRLKGRIRRYYHNNFNSSKDFHTVLDYTTGKLKRVDTRTATDQNGGKFREITGTSESTIDIPAPPRPPGTPGSSIAPVHGGTIVRSVAPDPAIPYCTAEDSDSLALVERLLSGDPDGPAAYHLASAGVDEVRREGDAVVVALTGDHPGGGISLVVPREAGGTDMLARVTVDGREVESEQAVSGTLRTVTLLLPAGAATIRIAPRPRGLADWRLWLLVSLGLLAGWILTGRRRVAATVAVFAPALMTSACVLSLAPAIPLSATVGEPGLVGTWVHQDETTTAVITHEGDGVYQLTYTTEDGDVGRFEGRLARVGPRLLFDVVATPADDEIPEPYAGTVIPGHLLLVLELEGDDLRAAALDPDEVESALEDGRLALRHHRVEETIVFTDSTAVLWGTLAEGIGRLQLAADFEAWRRVRP